MTVAELKALYEKATGKTWEPEQGIQWLCQNRESFDLNLYSKEPVLSKSAHITLSDKANWLSQQHCRVCNPTFPISVIPIRIRPESWQALESVNKSAFKSAIQHRLTSGHTYTTQTGRICLSFLFVCSSNRRRRDLDNMAKLLMDSVKGLVMEDDTNVDHLNLMRLTHEGEEEYVSFQISGSRLNNHDDTAYPHLQHSWAGAEPLNLQDFTNQAQQGAPADVLASASLRQERG
jgi:Holliday junction resolvase RusA-like endonuclease